MVKIFLNLNVRFERAPQRHMSSHLYSHTWPDSRPVPKDCCSSRPGAGIDEMTSRTQLRTYRLSFPRLT